jgi:membrane protein DedA with SNARE-associated domain
MTIESSFIPFPSEIILIPAGYLASQGKLNVVVCILVASFASVVGALINYYIAKHFGRNYILKKKKIIFINIEHLKKTQAFFKKYGPITIFFGRLIPIVRQYISLPAGFGNMDLKKFITYTFLGAFIWSLFLVLLGYYVGFAASSILTMYKLTIVIIFAVLIIGYLFINYILK